MLGLARKGGVLTQHRSDKVDGRPALYQGTPSGVPKRAEEITALAPACRQAGLRRQGLKPSFSWPSYGMAEAMP
jgi:hypothetical protein